MRSRPRFLSKSKLMSARQCLKRLYLEIHRPDLVQHSSKTEAAFEIGNQVGRIAHSIYGSDDAIYIPYEGGLTHALKKSRRLLAQGPVHPIFEATIQHAGVLVRIDALLPYGDSWQIIEVKASTTVKQDYLYDCAIQNWVFHGLGYTSREFSLAHIDNSFVYDGSGDYSGLLKEEDLTEDVERLAVVVPEWVDTARAAAAGPEPDVEVGSHCFSPYECPFVNHCWPMDSEYPVLNIGGGARKHKIAEWVADGIVDLRNIPQYQLNERQQRIQRITIAGEAELLPSAAKFVAELEFPRYYLDFETIMSPIPVFADTRPYETLPVQWSCHYESERDTLEHAEFLDLTGDAPMRRFADSLIRVLGTTGPVLTYSSYEERVINGLIDRFPDLTDSLQAIVNRLTDLLPIVREYYYHPEMLGSWSIKTVLPTIGSDLSYSDLEGIQEGMQASEGYLEALHPDTDADRKAELKQQLLAYCRHDTKAMVELLRFLASA
jgi:hypothetical protein